MSRLTNAEVRIASNAQRRRLLAGASGAALTLALVLPAGAAFAQAPVATNANAANLPTCAPGQTDTTQCKPPTGTELQTVVVTGSRIARRDYTSNSPIVTLSSQNLVQQSDLQIQNTLNKLPQFNPDQNMIGGQTFDVQNTPTHTLGIATASLRGLGPNRNLVLIDGRRAPPINAALAVDLNTVPSGMIDHVETITGGASATYGADAIGGVLNFVMKKNFHGADFDIQYSRNQRGDGNLFQANALFGTNFADDKGNITFYIERYQQDGSYQRNRQFYTKGWADPWVPTGGFFSYGTFYSPADFSASAPVSPGFNGLAFLNEPSQAAINSVFPNRTGTISPGSSFGIYGNIVYNGTTGDGAGYAGLYKSPYKPDGTNLATQYVQDSANGNNLVPAVKSNSTKAYVQQPLDRWSFVTNGHYDFNDWLTATFNASYERTHTDSFLTAPISVVGGWTFYVPYNETTDSPVLPGTTSTPNPNYKAPGTAGAQHPVPTEEAILLNSRPLNPNAPWLINWYPNPDGPLPARGTVQDLQLFQVSAGLEGKIPGNNSFTKDWTWSTFGTHSESFVYDVGRGDLSLSRLAALVTQPNWAQGANFLGNQTNPATGLPSPSPGFGAGQVNCTSGFYNTLFNGGPLSNDCYQAINAPIQSMNITKQDQVEFDLQGSLFKLPAGDLKFAAGGDYRRDSNTFNPDILQSYNSFTDEVVGVYPEPYNVAAADVKEGYAELDIPILADLPFIKSFSINPGARYSTYSASPGGWTYKVMGDFQVNDWLRFRGGYNLAVRAPNLGELFLPKTENFGGEFLPGGDPCSLLSTAVYGAGGSTVPTGSQTTIQGTATHLATGATQASANSAAYICQALMGSAGAGAFYNNIQAQQPSGGLFSFWVNQSGNANLKPERAGTYTAGVVLRSPIQNEWLRRFVLSIDYYKIHIDDMIEYTSQAYVFQNCFNNPGLTSVAQAQTYVNSNIYCQGIARNSSGGLALVNTPESNLATLDTAGVDMTLDWGIPLSEIHKSLPGVFTFSMNNTFLDHMDTLPFKGAGWSRWYGTLGPTLASINGGSYAYRLNTTLGYNVGPANISLNWRHLPQVHTAVALGTANVHTLDTSGYDIFDLNGFFNLPHGLQLRAGISNLFDKQPPTTGNTTPTLTNGVISTLANSGSGSTNAAYYDTIGRRFYVGLKARF